MMKDDKKAAPGATNTESGKAEMGSASKHTTISPAFECTTIAPSRQAVKIADFLSPGQQNAVPLRYLKDLLHLDGRTLRLMIRQERLSGVPILESSRAYGGYYLPNSPDERDLCVKRLRHRAAQIVAVADAIAEATIEKGEGGIA